MATKLTVVDVCKELLIPPTKEMMWSVGSTVRKKYRNEYGTLPPKELRPKTYGGRGSHCIAVYPVSMKNFIVDTIRAWRACNQ